MISTKGKFLISREAVRHLHARVVRWYRLHLLVVWRAFVWVSNTGHLFNINESIWKIKMYFYTSLVINLIIVTLRSTKREVQIATPPPKGDFEKGLLLWCWNFLYLFIHPSQTVFDMSNECPQWLMIPRQPSYYMHVMQKIDCFDIIIYSRHN